MDDSITSFYVQATGSSHIASGKPCQDSGLAYSNNGIHIAVVCDGHGGDCYVRSDVGSRLAANIARDEILRFIESNPLLFKGKKGCVPAVPTVNPLKDEFGRTRETADLSETELEQLRQNAQYFNESEKFPEIESAMRRLFADICNSWKEAIKADSKRRPFSPKERNKLGSRRLEKAFGSTLMAAVRTPDYWFAFHIGDGKLYSCDRLMGWKEPVPWDCNCFLNITTSLCDSHPVNEFRYAFDGTGNFPIAFVLGSDGIDDTFVTKEGIEKFYSQILTLFNERGKEDLIGLLEQQLPHLSRRGSHDDMSVAAVIDSSHLPNAVEYYNNILCKVRALTAERNQRQNAINKLEQEICRLRSEYDEVLAKRNQKASANWDWWKNILRQCEEKWLGCKQLSEKANVLYDKIAKSDCDLASQKEVFSKWEAESRNQVKQLKAKAREFENQIPVDSSVSQQEPETVTPIFLDLVDKHTETVNDEPLESDDPTQVYEKAGQSMMTEEDIERMKEEADKQTKEILNDNHK